MKIPIPFPKCKSCGEDAPKSYHKNCGGRMLVETTTDEVYCEKCSQHWNAWESTYYCHCGAKFDANDVREVLTEVLVWCKVCAEEFAAQQESLDYRKKITDDSIRAFLCGFFERIGYAFGLAVTTIIETVGAYLRKIF